PHHPHLPSFPTRRSSDLLGGLSGFLGFLNVDRHQGAVDLHHFERLILEVGVEMAAHPVEHEQLALAGALASGEGFHSHEFSSLLDRKSTRLNSSHVKISY